MFQQNDIHEMYVLLMNLVHNDIGKPVTDVCRIRETHHKLPFYHRFVNKSEHMFNRDADGKSSFVSRHMFGQWLKQICCGNCGFCHHNFETFFSIDVDIHEQDPYISNALSNAMSDKHMNDDKSQLEWTCDQCNHKSPSVQKTVVWKAPNVLCVCVKRFDAVQTGGRMVLTKNNIPVKIPQMIRFPCTNIVSDHEQGAQGMYRIESMACHLGNMNNGHYMSMVKNQDSDNNSENKWWIVDDDTVHPFQPPTEDEHGTMTSPHAYLLFYSRVQSCN